MIMWFAENFGVWNVKRCNQLNNNKFWLGGQIKWFYKFRIDKEINKKRLIDYGSPCNSFEMMSIYSSTKQLELIENMIIKFEIEK